MLRACEMTCPRRKGPRRHRQRRGAIERIRHDTVHSDAGWSILHCSASAEPVVVWWDSADWEVVSGAVAVWGPCFLRAFSCLCQALSSGAADRGNPTGMEISGSPHKKDGSAPRIAPTVLIAQFVEMRERMRGFRARVVRTSRRGYPRGCHGGAGSPAASHQELIQGILRGEHPR